MYEVIELIFLNILYTKIVTLNSGKAAVSKLNIIFFFINPPIEPQILLWETTSDKFKYFIYPGSHTPKIFHLRQKSTNSYSGEKNKIKQITAI